MGPLHAKILEKDGKKEFVVLPYEEFIQLQDELEDYEALKALRDAKAKESDTDTIPFDDVKKELDIE